MHKKLLAPEVAKLLRKSVRQRLKLDMDEIKEEEEESKN